MTNDEIGQELVDRLNEILDALGLPEGEGAGLLLEKDVNRAIALHADIPLEVARNLVQGCLVPLGMHGVNLGASLQQSFGGVAGQAMLLGALATKRSGS